MRGVYNEKLMAMELRNWRLAANLKNRKRNLLPIALLALIFLVIAALVIYLTPPSMPALVIFSISSFLSIFLVSWAITSKITASLILALGIALILLTRALGADLAVLLLIGSASVLFAALTYR